MSFQDRTDAGRRLAEALAGYGLRRPIVVALPRGGVPVAEEVARRLGAPLDVVLVRKIGVPSQPELAMGAVVDGPTPVVVQNREIMRRAGVSEAAFAHVREGEMAELLRRRRLYVGDRPRPDLDGRTVIVVDDGVATGATTSAALRAVRKQHPARLILAVPVAPTDTLEELRQEADEIVCLEDHRFFSAVGTYYADFDQVSDDEVVRILARSHDLEPPAGPQAAPG